MMQAIGGVSGTANRFMGHLSNAQRMRVSTKCSLGRNHGTKVQVALNPATRKIAWMSFRCCDNLVERDAPRNARCSTIEANSLAAIILACPPHKLGIRRLMRGTRDSYPTWD